MSYTVFLVKWLVSLLGHLLGTGGLISRMCFPYDRACQGVSKVSVAKFGTSEGLCSTVKFTVLAIGRVAFLISYICHCSFPDKLWNLRLETRLLPATGPYCSKLHVCKTVGSLAVSSGFQEMIGKLCASVAKTHIGVKKFFSPWASPVCAPWLWRLSVWTFRLRDVLS